MPSVTCSRTKGDKRSQHGTSEDGYTCVTRLLSRCLRDRLRVCVFYDEKERKYCILWWLIVSA